MTDPSEAAAAEAREAGPDRPDGEPPAWMRFLALLLAAAVLAFGSIGLLLAINGWYRPALAFPLGALVCVGVVVAARPAWKRVTPESSGAHRAAALGVAAIFAITAWNCEHASEHVLIDRDGGSYANTGRWIARDGSLEVKPIVGAFEHESTVGFQTQAVFLMPDGTLQFQFAHLLPTLLAESYAVGGDAGFFALPAVLGGVALLAFFALGWRLFRQPWFALSATLALAFTIPQVSFSRDSYSEIPSQVLLFTALWLLVHRRVLPRPRVALVAGLFLGAMQATRIDAPVFLIGVPVVLALVWLRADRQERRRAIPIAIGAFLVGIVPGFTLGLVDLTRHSGSYWSALWPDERKLGLVAGVSLIGSLIGLAIWRPVSPWLRRLPWPRLAGAAAVIVGVVGFGTWILRPRLQHMRGAAQPFIAALQQAEHVRVDIYRAYYEHSLDWMVWYLGPVTVAAAIIGAALLVRALLLGRSTRVFPPLAILVPGSLLYLLKASATPDHVWVMRRFLVSAIPTLILLALGAAACAWGVRAPARFAPFARMAAVLVAVVAVGFPLFTVYSVRSMSEKRGFLAVMSDACHDVGPHAAIVVLERDHDDAFDDWVPQALRGWCGAKVGIAASGVSTSESLHGLAHRWAAVGTPFYVAATSPDVVLNVLPDVNILATRNVKDPYYLNATLTHRPRSYRQEAFSFVLARVPDR